jgi:hypothetical protein
VGRNSIPKLGEWRGGKLYEFVSKDDTRHNGPPKPDDGRMIVYRMKSPGIDGMACETVLATAFADGFQECMASMFTSGYGKGEKAGYERAKAEMRAALGVQPA